MELAATTRRPPDLVPFDLADCLPHHRPATTTEPLLLLDMWSSVAMLLLEQSHRRNLPSLTCSTPPPSINCSSTMPSPAQRSCNLRFGEPPPPRLPYVGHRTRGVDSGSRGSPSGRLFLDKLSWITACSLLGGITGTNLRMNKLLASTSAGALVLDPDPAC